MDELHALVTQRADVPPGNVDVELTESARPRDLAQGARQLGRLRELGYAVWFDDFGTGWSELHPPGGRAGRRHQDRPVLHRARSAVGPTQWSGRCSGWPRISAWPRRSRAIATQEQADRALELGCDLAQGYLWSRAAAPRPAAEALLAGRSLGA